MKVTYSPKDLTRAFDLCNRVAPTAKGGAWDKAAGMVMDIEPSGRTTLLATDIDTAVHVVIDAEAITDAPEETTRWRMSSLFLAPFIKKLSKPIVVEHDGRRNALTFKSGTSKLLVPLMDASEYPDLHMPSGAAPVDGANLVSLSERVMWACDGNGKASGSALSGLHADGVNIVGCRHEGMGVLDVPLDIEGPITFPAQELIGLVKGFSDIRISADDTKVFLWLSDTDWVSSSLILAPYPAYGKLRRDTYASSVKVNRSALIDCLDRMAIVAAQDRADMPKVVVTISKTKFHLKLTIKDVGDSEESVTISDGPESSFQIAFSLGFLMDAVRNVDGNFFEFSFGMKDDEARGPLSSCRLTDETGWEALLMPRR